MLYLLNFFADAATDGSTAGTDGSGNSWLTWVILGVLVVGMILMMVIPQRKQKKRAEEMMSKLNVGSIVTTIGGIVGEVVQLDDKHIWISTGVDGNKTTMQFLRQAIHSVSTESAVQAEVKAEAKEDNEEDEIK
ncbi:MAG TPA: preprotein translocase subunit YajC [Candidatus Fimimonas merdipullorum]|uniref:Sec translocon accessory complex subunit YajC n=1 Tax=Candidatus Fimimonas merdipullorum TaxID=2840822 RepID=A0A9D1MXF0_9BACT|nr:preprotein translocase subunit YajC [Candidatus Fimimonas merdipullorum]